MGTFTEKEIAYLREHRIGRLATVDSKGRPHVVSTGFNVDADKVVRGPTFSALVSWRPITLLAELD